MRVKHFFDGPIAVMLLLSVPALALFTLSPWGAATQASMTPVLGVGPEDGTAIPQATNPGETVTHDPKIVDLSDWNYTAHSKKSQKSKKSRKSPKSIKSKKSKKRNRNRHRRRH